MKYANVLELEHYIRRLIKNRITRKHRHIYTLNSKKAVDILICRDGSEPALFFLEIKYHKKKHGRMGFGSRNGGGFQPELVRREPLYFESNLRWILGSETHSDNGLIFTDSATIREYVSGGAVGDKFNSIQARLFREKSGLNERKLVAELERWLLGT